MRKQQPKFQIHPDDQERMSCPEIPSWPACSEEEQDAAIRVLQSGKLNYWTGEEGKLFEKEFADFVGTEHAIAVANGTVGLELALAALDIGAGDEVLVPSRTFIATASAVVARGATPVCIDVDRISQNVTPETMAAKLTPKTRAVIAVHLAGWPCAMNEILEFAKQHDLWVIEDCAQAHGARLDDRHVGSMGHIGVFSFCQDKIMTTAGEGGMFVTNDHAIWNRAWSIKDHGKDFDAVHKKHALGFRWLHNRFGTNWRLTEVQSAIGRIALRKLPQWICKRREHATLLNAYFEKIPALRPTLPPGNAHHSYYKCYTFVRPELLNEGWNRDRIMLEISNAGVPCYSGSCSEIYLEQAFSEKMRPSGRLPVAKELGETSLMFLVHPTLEAEHMDFFCANIETVFSRASKSDVRSKRVAA